MLYLAEHLRSFHLNGVDGRVGKIKDIYFDDATWTIRYFVVDTGSWLQRQEVLISPDALTGVSEEDKALTTDLTLKQVGDSPHPESDPPASRQYGERLHEYYGWNPYWDNGTSSSFGMYSYPVETYPHQEESREFGQDERAKVILKNPCDTHLRSFKQIIFYGIHASDGEIGEVSDLLVEPDTWRITHLLAATRTWWPGKHVVIDIAMVRSISFVDQSITLAMTREDIKAAPEYQPGTAIEASYQTTLSSHYRGLASKSRRPENRRTARALPELHRGI